LFFLCSGKRNLLKFIFENLIYRLVLEIVKKNLKKSFLKKKKFKFFFFFFFFASTSPLFYRKVFA